MFKIILKKKKLIVLLNDKKFLTQYYIVDKIYTFFFISHLLNKYGFEAN